MSLSSFRRPAAAAAALSLILAPVAPAFAQDVEKEPVRPAIEQRRSAQEQRAATEASKLSAPGEDVTYDQVLADPDNLELNYRYARTQVRRGDLKGAAATLERMLLIDPNKPRVRLFYAVVLYRLDNVVEAKRELETLKALNLGGPLGDEVDGYLKLVDNRIKKNHLSGRGAVGFQYDTNRNAAPASGERLFADTPIPLSGSSQRRDDTSALFLAGLDYRRDFGNGHEAFVQGNYYRAEQTLLKYLNLQAYSAAGGVTLRSGRDSITPTVLFDHVMLAQASYLRDRGVDVRYEHKIGRNGDVYVQFHDVYEDFVQNPVVPTADERDGIDLYGIVGGDYVMNPTMRLGLGLLAGTKHATRHYNAYDRTGLLGTHTWLLGKGTFLLSNAVFTYDQYKQPDAALTARYRRDTNIRLSATYGAPLSLLYKPLNDFIFTFTYEYYHALSTVENYGYSNNKVNAMVTYKFDLGF